VICAIFLLQFLDVDFCAMVKVMDTRAWVLGIEGSLVSYIAPRTWKQVC
jgi:hypothetical protein